MRNSKKLNFVDLFAGAGGFSLAAIQCGMNPTLCVEQNKHAADSYRNNLVDGTNLKTKIYQSDVATLDPRQLFSENYKSNMHCDLMLGGPPCQGFSTHRLSNTGVGDGRNDLIHKYFDFVKVFRPSVFIMENVPGILWPRHEQYIEQFYKSAKNSGYKVLSPELLDARDYGVPQRRKRVFIVGILKEYSKIALDWPPKATHIEPKKRHPESELLPWVSCGDVFKRTYAGDPNNRHMNHGKELIDAFKKTPPNGGSREQSGRVLPCHENHDGHRDVYGRIDPKVPAPTMTTACINPSKGRFVHPSQHHGITLRQAARIQTFPDDYIFEGGLIASGSQIGNAVPVVLGVTVVNAILPCIISINQMRAGR